MKNINVNFVELFEINGEERLMPILDSISKNLTYHNTIWKSDIIVINEGLLRNMV